MVDRTVNPEDCVVDVTITRDSFDKLVKIVPNPADGARMLAEARFHSGWVSFKVDQQTYDEVLAAGGQQTFEGSLRVVLSIQPADTLH